MIFTGTCDDFLVEIIFWCWTVIKQMAKQEFLKNKEFLATQVKLARKDEMAYDDFLSGEEITQDKESVGSSSKALTVIVPPPLMLFLHLQPQRTSAYPRTSLPLRSSGASSHAISASPAPEYLSVPSDLAPPPFEQSFVFIELSKFGGNQSSDFLVRGNNTRRR